MNVRGKPLATTLAMVLIIAGCSDSDTKPKSGRAAQEDVERTDAAYLDSLTAADDALTDAELATCFWIGPISMRHPSTTGFDGANYNYPESSASYWAAKFSLQPGQSIELQGEAPFARYFSFNTYREGAPIATLTDVDIRMDEGVPNPYQVGSDRYAKERSYTVTAVQGEPTTLQSANRIALGTAGPEGVLQLVYRVYRPDAAMDLRGGVALPTMSIRNADGSTVPQEEACKQINAKDRDIPILSIPPDMWRSAVNSSPDPSTAPALNPPKWERFFDQNFASSVFLEGTPRAAERNSLPQPDTGGFYSNADNRYLVTHLSSEYGPVLVLRATMPTFPDTRWGTEKMPDGQLRFWSLCSGESRATMRTPACLADDEVPLSKNREYTIVVSTKKNRPSNAKQECGVAWLDWGDRGDGVDRTSYGLLILRNMKPKDDFAEAIQRVTAFGQEAAVMGKYFPSAEYMSVDQFEQQGCPE